MEEQTWIDNANTYNGVLVVWVNQGSDPLLMVANSKGLCFAMSFDFVTAYQMGQPGPSNFVNEIRNALLRWPHTSRIPYKYIDIQAASQAMLDQYRQTLTQLYSEYNEAEANDQQPILVTIEQLLNDRIKQRFGPGMESFVKFTEPNMIASLKIFKTMTDFVTQNGPSYFLLSMRGATGGHGVGFGFRPDLSANPKFPGIFEYFDANLGLFVFRTVQEFSDFFQLTVWFELYGNTDYNKFEIASFLARPGIR